MLTTGSVLQAINEVCFMMMVWDETVSGALGKTTSDRWAKLALLQSHEWQNDECAFV